MSISKRYLKTKPICKAKFTILKEDAMDARQAFLVGDFNDWSINSLPMQQLKNGDFTTTIDLPCNSVFHFKYLLHNSDSIVWQNDSDADDYSHSPLLDSDNCVLITKDYQSEGDEN